MILGIKTADFSSTLALVESDGQVRHEVSWDSGRNLSSELLAKIQQVLGRGGISLANVSGIVIFSGPGSFTSLRIGHSVANALADSLGVPVVGAAGERWLADGAAAVKRARPGRPALPEYGAAVHITRPRA